MDTNILELQNLINESNFTVVITGAGISVSSGILDMQHMNVFQVMQIALEKLVLALPEHSYKILHKSFLRGMFEMGPSIAHKKLAELEERGLIQGIITNNIDHLHTLAGSKNVIEVQGSYGVNKCIKCNAHYNDVNIWNKGKAPRCTICNGVILSYPVYSHIGFSDSEMRKANMLMSKAELVIIIGARGVYRNINPKAKLVQINPQSTIFDSQSDINIRKNADDVFSLIV